MNCYYFVGIQCKEISMIKSGFTIICNNDLRYDNILDYFNQCSKNYECYLIKSITSDEFEKFNISVKTGEQILKNYLNEDNEKISITDKLKLSYLVRKN